MRNKKIYSLLMIFAISTSLLMGCNKAKEEVPPTTEVEQTVEQKLTEYTEEGMTILKNNYTTTDEMKLALKNIGVNISDMKFKTYDGNEISIKDYKGKDMILEISQAKCDSCKKASPLVHEAVKGTGVELVHVFLNSTNETVDEYYKEINLEKPSTIIMDNDRVTKEKFELKVTPTFIYVDKTGTISLIKEKYVDDVHLKEDIKLAFGDKKIYEYKETKK